MEVEMIAATTQAERPANSTSTEAQEQRLKALMARHAKQDATIAALERELQLQEQEARAFAYLKEHASKTRLEEEAQRTKQAEADAAIETKLTEALKKKAKKKKTKKSAKAAAAAEAKVVAEAAAIAQVEVEAEFKAVMETAAASKAEAEVELKRAAPNATATAEAKVATEATASLGAKSTTAESAAANALLDEQIQVLLLKEELARERNLVEKLQATNQTLMEKNAALAKTVEAARDEFARLETAIREAQGAMLKDKANYQKLWEHSDELQTADKKLTENKTQLEIRQEAEGFGATVASVSSQKK